MSKNPEGQILAAILQYLQAKRILAFRMNTGIANIQGRFVGFGVAGMADILAFKPVNPILLTSDPLWIECKAPKGKQSALQVSFQRQVEEYGHLYIVARSIEDVEAALR